VKRCLNALEELGTLQVTSQILQKNTDVVATLKKVRGEGREQREQWQWGAAGRDPTWVVVEWIGGRSCRGWPAVFAEWAASGPDSPI
jgi:hypothetical protein